MVLRRATLAAVLLVIASPQGWAQKIYRCDIQDGVYIERGKLVRNDFVQSRIAAFSPIIVDTASGVLRRGNLPAAQWVIVQRATPDAFFTATMHTAPAMANDRITLLHQLTPIEFVYYYETSMVFSGTCDVLG